MGDFRHRRKILFCLRYGIGDLIMELPALEALRQAAPEAHLTLLGARPAIELLEGDRRVDSLLAIQDLGLNDWGDRGGPAIRGRIAAWLVQEGFDLVLDPSHAVRAVGETIWAHSPVIRDAGAGLQNEALCGGAGGQQAVLAAVRAGWGIEVEATAMPGVELRPADRHRAARFRRRLPGGPPIAVSPVASSPLKRWPADRFAAVVAELLAETVEPVLLFCGPEEDRGDAMLDALGRSPRILPVGPLHLRQVAALLAGCRIFIGHDTGLMHLAAAVGVSPVALFGPTSPEIYLPAQVSAIALGGRDGCPHRRRFAFGPPRCVAEGRCLVGRRSCIDTIEPAQVLTAVRHLLANGAGNGERGNGNG